MPEESTPKSQKKMLGLSPVTWLLIAGGGIASYVIYRKYRGNSAAAGISDGQTTPGNSTTSGATSGPNAPATLAEWAQQFISNATNGQYSPAAALNDFNAWLNGNCVSQTGFNAIGSAIETLGTPPGYNGVLPSLSVCSNGSSGGGSSTSTPPSATGGTSNGTSIIPKLPASLAAAMTNNGEHIVADVYDSATQTYLYLTQKGGVYTLDKNGNPGGVFYGSYLGLPPQDTETAPGQTRSFTNIIANANGTYELVSNVLVPGSNSQYETYNFAPGTPQNA